MTPTGIAPESTTVPSAPAMHRHILELLRQDVAKIPQKPKETPAPFLNPDVPANNQPVVEGVLELEPLQVTKKKAIELPVRIKPVSLDNFFYGDGAIFKTKDGGFVITAGRDGLRFTKKF